jgi:hypothetical protein
MNLLKTAFLSLALLCSLSLVRANAAEGAKASDPTGKWTWSMTTPNGETRTSTLNLKKEGDKLTGTVTGRQGNEVPISNGTVKGDEISFEVVREREGNKFTSKFSGKVAGDTIKGKSEFNINGEARSRDWEAKREGASKSTADSKSGADSKANFSGNWKYTFSTPDGNTIEPTMKLKQEADKVTGSVEVNGNDAKIEDVQLKGNELNFTTRREFNENKIVSKYSTRLEGNTIKGKVQVKFNDQERSYDFEARKE